MSEYMLVKRESLEEIAAALREQGYSGRLDFPDGFIYAIGQIGPNKPEAGGEVLTLSPVTNAGESVYDSNGYLHSNYFAVGHSSKYIKNDAVWAFTPTINASSAKFTFSWNNTTDKGTNVGWAQSYEYAFYITSDNTVGQKIPGEQVSTKIIQATEYGTSGTIVVEFSNLELKAGTPYFIRVNYKDYLTKSTLKAFQQFKNTVDLSV